MLPPTSMGQHPHFKVSANPSWMLLRDASKDSSQIGWINILKGRAASKWQGYVVMAHICSKLQSPSTETQ
jgi:hypothetical protein